MSSTTSEPNAQVKVLRHQASIVQQVVKMNTDGLSQADSLVQPSPAGNCMNWVVGHLVAVYNQVLPVVHQEPTSLHESLTRYNRGSRPIQSANDALGIDELLAEWNEACARYDAGLKSMTAEELLQLAPMSPTNNPDETIGTLLNTISWHQAYHSGQTGLLRRLAGKDGAIA